MRQISIPTIYYRVIQSHFKNVLKPKWESVFEKINYWFRPKRVTDYIMYGLRILLNKENFRKSLVDSNISKCFYSTSYKCILK